MNVVLSSWDPVAGGSLDQTAGFLPLFFLQRAVGVYCFVYCLFVFLERVRGSIYQSNLECLF